ncbi:hypothetical protein GOBAR_DD36668 [Gossypium barbadense]|nr:hypothetical protein GOBAR_DD36668 [Gossypium barbadense]
MQIIRLPNKTATSFGTTFMVDDPLTEKPKPTSKLVGRAQGIYAFASQSDLGLLMVMNFAFNKDIMRDHNGNWLAGFMSIGSTSVTEADTIHGTLPLKDEKQFIRGIKQLKQTHEKL